MEFTGERRSVLVAGVIAVLVAAAAVVTARAGATERQCDVAVTPDGFEAAVRDAAPGATLCLAEGDYGTFAGVDKAITIRAEQGVSARMRLSLGEGDGGFTLEGLDGMGGLVREGARAFVVRDSTFDATVDIEATDADIVFDGNRHTFDARWSQGSPNAKIFVWNVGQRFSGVTIQNSTISGGDLDGLHLSAGVDAIGNVFSDLCDEGTNHTDNVQFEGGRGGRIARNLVYAGPDCITQGITSYDGRTVGVTIEDNVVDIRRPWGIELYSDTNSTVRRNTLRWYPPDECFFALECGQIEINRKAADPPGTGTQVYDNLATAVAFENGSTGVAYHNVSSATARFVGPLTSYAGFRLAPDSPVGRGAASDGGDVGARVDPSVPTPTPTATAAASATATETATPTVTATPTAALEVPQLPAPRPVPSVAPRALIASYGFEERSGSRVLDSSGMGHDGRNRGAARTRAGRHGRGLVFDGSGDHVLVPDALALETELTVAAWVRPAAIGGRRSVIVKRGPSGPAYELLLRGDRVAARVRAGREWEARGAAKLRPKRWTHLAASFDGRVLRVYVNGRQAGARAVRGTFAAEHGELRVGDGFNGRIDDVRLWRTALSPLEVRAQRALDAATMGA